MNTAPAPRRPEPEHRMRRTLLDYGLIDEDDPGPLDPDDLGTHATCLLLGAEHFDDAVSTWGWERCLEATHEHVRTHLHDADEVDMALGIAQHIAERCATREAPAH